MGNEDHYIHYCFYCQSETKLICEGDELNGLEIRHLFWMQEWADALLLNDWGNDDYMICKTERDGEGVGGRGVLSPKVCVFSKAAERRKSVMVSAWRLALMGCQCRSQSASTTTYFEMDSSLMQFTVSMHYHFKVCVENEWYISEIYCQHAPPLQRMCLKMNSLSVQITVNILNCCKVCVWKCMVYLFRLLST